MTKICTNIHGRVSAHAQIGFCVGNFPSPLLKLQYGVLWNFCRSQPQRIPCKLGSYYEVDSMSWTHCFSVSRFHMRRACNVVQNHQGFRGGGGIVESQRTTVFYNLAGTWLHCLPPTASKASKIQLNPQKTGTLLSTTMLKGLVWAILLIRRVCSWEMMGTSRLHAQPLYAYTAIYFLRFYALINILVVIYIFFLFEFNPPEWIPLVKLYCHWIA